MPYKSAAIKFQGLQDRRRKLTDEQVEDIKKLYVPNVVSAAQLARMFNVSKKTILLIVSKQVKGTQQQYNKEHWRERRTYTKDEWASVMREHRQYKHKLLVEGKLSDNK